MNAIFETINAAGRAFVEFALPMLVQSTVLILVLLVVDLLLRKRVRAVFRYWIWMLVLIKLVLPPSLWSPVSVGRWFGDELHVSAEAIIEDDRPPTAEPPSTALQILSQPAPLPMVPIAGVTEPGAAMVEPPTPPIVASGERAIEPDVAGAPSPARPLGLAPAASVTALDWRGFALLAWAGVAVALLLLLLQRAVFVRGLVAQAGQASASMQNVLDECKAQVGLGGAVSLKISPNATSPAVCGLARPVILIPRNLAPKISRHDLHAVLLHELAHVKRGDLWISLAQTLLQIVYFYNPLFWLANAVIRRIREKAVDEAVLVAMGESASDYPESLLNVARLAFKRRPVLSLRLIGVVESKSALTARIKHILNRPFPRTARLGALGLLAIVLVAAVMLPMAKARPLTDRAGKIIKLAEEEARALNHGYIGTEHILVALARDGEAVSARVLAKLGVDVDTLRAEMARLVQPGADPPSKRRLPRTPRAKRVMKYAQEEARTLGHDYIGTEHILLAVMCERNGLGAQMLGNLGLTLPGVRAELQKFVRAANEDDVSGNTTVPIPSSEPQPSRFAARLSNAVTVELLGVCTYPGADRQWWRPDGGSLPEAPCSIPASFALHPSDGETVYGFVAQVAHVPNDTRGAVKVPSARTQASYDTAWAVDGAFREDIWYAEAILPKNRKTCTVRCEVATDIWAEFENVSLRSGGSTNPVVKVEPSGELQGRRKSVLPDVDHEAVMLDLASGQLVSVPDVQPPEKLLEAIQESGKGDIVLDTRSLILIRGATSKKAEDGPADLVKVVKIDSNLPETVTVTTAEGRQYEITVLSIDDEACTLTYSRSPVEPMQTRSPSVVTVHADERSSALAFQVAVSREEVSEAVVDECVKAFLAGLPRTSGDYGWFEVRPNVTFSPELVTQEREGKVYLLLRTDAANAMRSGDDWAVERVKAATDAMGRPAVRVWLDDKGGERLHALTKANVKKTLPILVEGRVVGAPEVMSPVRNAVLIVGNYTQREVQEMIDLLRPKPPEQPVTPAVDVLANLRQLALGVVLFANDHDGDLPSTLTAIERYVPDRTQFAWMRAHVTYVGKGNVKRETKPYAVPIAYKKAPKSVGGAYVAFMDGHVVLVSSERWKELGIEPAASDDGSGELHFDPVGAIRKMLGQWVVDAKAGDMEALKNAYPPDSPRSEDEAKDLRELLSLNPGWKFSLLSVAWDDEAAMAVSGKLGAGDPKDEPEPVVLVWNLEKLEDRWVITDIDLEEIAGLQRENAYFLQEHPGASVRYLEPGPPAISRGGGAGPLGTYALAFDGVDDCLVVPASASLTFKPPFFVEVWAQPDLSVLPEHKPGRRFDPRNDRWLAMDFICQGGTPKSTGPADGDSKADAETVDGWPVPSTVSRPLIQPLQSGGFVAFLRGGVFKVDETSHASQTGLVRTNQVGVDRPGWTHYYFELRRDNVARKKYVPAEGPLVIGRVVRNGFPFKGRIAEVRIWNKELSAGDIRYIGSTSVTGNEPNLVACWTFEDGAGQIVHDITPSANHAYLGGSEDAEEADPKWVDLTQNEASAPSGITGRVVDADGKAVAGAQVAFCTETIHVTIQDGRLSHPRASDMEKGEITATGAQGLFRFDSEAPADFSLIAAHDDGFALVELDGFRKDREIRLERWGRIEGQLASGRTAQGNQISMCGLPNSTWRKHRYDFRYETKCDGQGRFAFERVPAGRFEVGYLASTGRGSASVTSRTPVFVDSGRTATMKLGGEGRPVIGKLVPPQGYHGPIYFGQGLRLLSTSRPEEPRPENYDRMTRREQQAWHSKWRQTPEAEAFYEAMWSDPNWRHYCFSIQQDGSFRIEDVIPGTYNLLVGLEERFTGQGRPEEIGGYNGIVEVPPMAEASTDEPLDLGELTLSMRHPLHVGDTVPPFEAETLDGKAISLADYRGRHVLLSFWSPTFHPELERLKELHADYRKTGQLQIIGLGGADTRDEVTSYIDEHNIPWPQIYFGPDWNADLFKKLGGQMQIILIDPEGKAVATWLREDKLSDTVREAVAFAWQRTDGYVAPDPEGFFPDDVEGGKRLDALFKAVDKDRRSDEEILSTVRRGFRRTKEYRSNILRWIGNRYVWGEDPQNAEAIEIMYHAVAMERHYAIYFGLSVVKDKTPNILRTLAEICMQREDVGRITWGVGAQRDELVAFIKPYLDDSDPQKRETASVLVQHFEGKLDFDRHREEKRLEQAKVEFADQLPQFKQILLTGDSRARREILTTIQRERLAALLDDSFIPAFQACGADPDRKVRNEVARTAGGRWVWGAQEQDPDAIALMLELASDKVRDVRYNAVYYGLSVVRDKTEPVIRRLVELALSDHENNLYGRIVWGLKGPMRASPGPFEKILAEYLEASESNDHLAASVYLLYHDVLQKEPPAEWNLARIKQQYPDDLFTVTFSAREPFAPPGADALWNEFAKTLPEKAEAKRMPSFRRGKPFACVVQVRSQQQADIVRQTIEDNSRLSLGQVRPVPLWRQLYEEEKRGVSSFPPDDEAVASLLGPKVSEPGPIQQRIDAAAPGDTIRLEPGLHKEGLVINKPLTLEGAGWDKTVIMKEKLVIESFEDIQRMMFQRLSKATSDLEREQMAAQMRKALAESVSPTALRVEGAQNVVIRGIKFTSPGGHVEGTSINLPLVAFDDSNVRFENCAVIGGPGGGIDILNAADATIERTLVAAVWGTGITVGGKADTSSRVHLLDCDVRNCHYAGVRVGAGSNDARIERCRISGAAWHGIRYDNASPRVVNNLIFGNARSGIYASGETAAVVSSNVFYANEMCGISCWFQNADTIEGNTFVENKRSGLEILGVSKPTVRRNIFYANPTGVFLGNIGSESRFAQSDGTVALDTNLFWTNENDVAWRPDANTVETITPGDETHTLQTDPQFAAAATKDFSLAADSVARQKNIGVADPIPLASPWPLQPEERAIIPEGDTRDSRQWRHAN